MSAEQEFGLAKKKKIPQTEHFNYSHPIIKITRIFFKEKKELYFFNFYTHTEKR